MASIARASIYLSPRPYVISRAEVIWVKGRAYQACRQCYCAIQNKAGGARTEQAH